MRLLRAYSREANQRERHSPGSSLLHCQINCTPSWHWKGPPDQETLSLESNRARGRFWECLVWSPSHRAMKVAKIGYTFHELPFGYYAHYKAAARSSPVECVECPFELGPTRRNGTRLDTTLNKTEYHRAYLDKAFLFFVEIGPIVDDLSPNLVQIFRTSFGIVAIAQLSYLLWSHTDNWRLRSVRRTPRMIRWICRLQRI